MLLVASSANVEADFAGGELLETFRAGTYEAAHSLCSQSSGHRLQAQYKFVRVQAISCMYEPQAHTHQREERANCTFSLYGLHRITSIYVVTR